jgi:hypothetical protein
MTSAKRPSLLAGYNTGVRYRGAEYHVQTEDSGIDHPHVITHLFARGGHIIATRKTSYAEHVGTDAYPAVVHQLIRAQHKQMLVALRDGEYDRLLPDDTTRVLPTPAIAPSPAPPAPSPARTSPAHSSAGRGTRQPSRPSRLDVESTRDSLDEIIVGDLVRLFDD